MAARTLLLKLEQRGWIELPARRRTPSNRMRHKRLVELDVAALQTPVTGPLQVLLPLIIRECSGTEGTAVGQRALFDGLLHRYHYLSHRSSVGENLQYLVCDAQARRWPVCSSGRQPGSVPRGTSSSAGQRHCGRASSPRRQQHPFSDPALGWGGPFSQPCFEPDRPAPQSRLADPIWPSCLSVGDLVQRDRFVGTTYRAANWLSSGKPKAGRGRTEPMAPRTSPPSRMFPLSLTARLSPPPPGPEHHPQIPMMTPATATAIPTVEPSRQVRRALRRKPGQPPPAQRRRPKTRTDRTHP